MRFIFIAIGVISMLLFNIVILYSIIIPDPCYYHSHEINQILKIFYDGSPASNGHPEPTLINFGITIVFGVYIANWYYRKYKKWKTKTYPSKN